MFKIMFVLLMVLAGCQQGEQPMNYSEALEQSPAKIISVVDNDMSKILVVQVETHRGETNIGLAMKQVVCALKDTMPTGYTLRIGAKLSNSMTVGTATVSEAAVRAGEVCEFGKQVSEVADEYNISAET